VCGKTMPQRMRSNRLDQSGFLGCRSDSLLKSTFLISKDV
jgi:hypothetical protein